MLKTHELGQVSTAGREALANIGTVLSSNYGINLEQAHTLIHNWIPAQVPLQLVTVIDTRGCYLPFYLETINSKEVFVAVLKGRFHDLGTRKIERGEWFLEELTTGQRLDLSKPWHSVIKCSGWA